MWFLSCGSFFLVISLLSEWSIENTHSVRIIFWINLAWNFRIKLNELLKLKTIELLALALVTVINYITNYVTSILLIFWYYLLAPVANLWAKPFLKSLEQSVFYQMHTLVTDLSLLLFNLKNSVTASRV